MSNAIYDLWSAGFVNRWHTFPDPRLRNSGDTVASHSWRVAVLVYRLSTKLYMSPDDALSAVMGAIFHDAGEGATADLPGPFKHDNPDIARSVDSIAAAWLYGRHVFSPTSDAVGLLSLCDSLDHYLTICFHTPDLAEREDVAGLRRSVQAKAVRLSLADAIESIITAQELSHDYRLGAAQ